MKTLIVLRKSALIIVVALTSILGITTSLSCEDPCDTLALADLTIPVIADALDQFGNPIIDPVTGQRIQALNEIFFNQRTGEYFNSDNPPTQGLIVGDVIQMATSVYNVFSESDCQLGANAAPTATDAKLNVSGSPYPELNGVFQLGSMPTPNIPYNSSGYTATAFNLATPGYYSVNMNANVNRTIDEHSYNNNFYVGDEGNYNRNAGFHFYVDDNPDLRQEERPREFINQNISPNTLEELENLTVYRFVKSDAYKKWIITNYGDR